MFDVDKFSKVWRLAIDGSTDGERAAARGRAEAIASAAGMDLPGAVTRMQKANGLGPSLFEGFDEFCEAREAGYIQRSRAAAAEREAARQARRAAALQRFGSEEAVFARTAEEAALWSAVRPLADLIELDGFGAEYAQEIAGWGWLRGDIPESVRRAVHDAVPFPATVEAVIAELAVWDDLLRLRLDFGGSDVHNLEVEARIRLLRDAAKKMPATSWDDLIARIKWFNDEHDNALADVSEFCPRVLADVKLLRAQQPRPTKPRRAKQTTSGQGDLFA